MADNLWKKESNETSALYVDIFANKSDLEFCAQNYAEIHRRFGASRQKKCNRISLAHRKTGNSLFAEAKWVAAIEQYNNSLRFAETGSPNISLALANRSACFFHLKMYEECLKDITSAKQTQYPENLMFKLEQRERDCLNNIGEIIAGPFDNIGRKLSYDADESFPCMANVLQIMSDDNGNFYTVAKEDIGVGQTVVIEPAFTSYLYMHYGHKCNICLKERSNLRPCKNCTSAMFCSDDCERHYLHELECNLKFCEHSQTNGQILEGVRLIILIVNQFANANELIDFVEQVMRDRYELPTSLADFKSQYRAFLKCSTNSEFIKSDNYLLVTYCTYTFIMTVPKVNEWFPSPLHRRFLAHLIGQHVRVFEMNSIRTTYLNDKNTMLAYMGLMNLFFRHSCAPNILNCECDGHNSFVTIRPVKKGDRLQISYVDPRASQAKRQLDLQNRYQIKCNCMRCNYSSTTPASDERKQISSDPNFNEIVHFDVENLYVSSAEESLKIIEKCITSLEKCKDISWCTEIEQIVDVFIKVLRIHLASPLPYSFEDLVMGQLNI
ncbi:SET and MYND domain-containing protein DDB_G0273589-like [Bradysia coprophila]|uniref:SET and MYND domain-containing protein DDB_G0273589-like n=1 Tax=Bradysia coprophila TaxID=38358 RepID=UPI00187D8770|nr:SET and MYND domain-containing protein DDB_G0273589-like [Bradysia coprophila]